MTACRALTCGAYMIKKQRSEALRARGLKLNGISENGSRRGAWQALAALGRSFSRGAGVGLIALAATVWPIAAQAETQETSFNLMSVQNGAFGSADDSVSAAIPIGFSFTYGGVARTQAYVSTNGVLYFTNPSSRFSNAPLAEVTGTDAIYAFWDDLYLGTGGNEGLTRVLYKTIGEPGNRVFVVQWTNVYCFGEPLEVGTFNVVLHEATGVIDIYYRDMLNASEQRRFGNSATIGLVAGQSVTQFSVNQPLAIEGKHLRFVPTEGAYAPYTLVESQVTPENDAQIGTFALIDPNMPRTPIELSAIAQSESPTSATISWAMDTVGMKPSHFRIRYATDPQMGGSSYTEDILPPGSPFVLQGLEPGETYYYQVVAYNNGSLRSSAIGQFQQGEPIPPFSTTVNSVLVQGAPVPNDSLDPRIPENATWRSFGPPAINESGELAYMGRWRSPSGPGTGIFVDSALVVKVGDAVPGMEGATFRVLRDPVIDPSGRLAFLASIAGVGVSSANDSVVIGNGPNGTLQLLAREGEAAPGASGAIYKSFGSVSVKGDEEAGGIIFTATLKQGTGEPSTTLANDMGAWWLPPAEQSVMKLVREGDAGFAQGEIIKSFQLLTAFNASAGQGRGHRTADSALLRLTFDGPAGPRQAQVLATAGTLTEFTKTGDTLGGSLLPEAVWSRMNLASFGNLGMNLSAAGTLQPNVGGVTVNAVKGIFASSNAGETWEPIVRDGDVAPGTEGLVFSSTKDPVNSGTGADLAFLGVVKGATSSTNDGLWFRPAEGKLKLVAREGGDLPLVSGPEGAKWKSFTSVALPGNGLGPVFTAFLQKGSRTVPGPGGVMAADDFGLYATHPDGSPRELIREGQPLLGKTVRTFSVLKTALGSAGTKRSFNDGGSIVVLVTFTDYSTAIVRVDLLAEAPNGGEEGEGEGEPIFPEEV